MSRIANPVPQFFLDDGSVASSGRLYFYENKNFAQLKGTFSQPDNTIANQNPLKLTGSGRLPPCFGEGLYSVKFFSGDPDDPYSDGTLLWSRDDVDLSGGGDSAFSGWSPVQTYGIGSIVKDLADYYRLYGSTSSKNERPSTSPTKWEKIVFITEHINGRSYPDEYIVIKNGRLYASNVNGNVTTPPSASWDDISFNNAIATNSNKASASAPSTGISGPYSFDFYDCGQIVFFSGYVSFIAGGSSTVTIGGAIAAGFRPSYDFSVQSFRDLSLGEGMVNFLASGNIDITRNASTGSGLSYVSGHYKKA